MKTAPDIIKEVTVTNKEFIKVMTQLGYRNESNSERYRFVNDKYNSIVHLPPLPLEDLVQKEYLAIYSYQLYMQGVIRQEENLVKKIQLNRVKKSPPPVSGRMIPSIINEVTVTNGELMRVLTQLGYTKEMGDKIYRFTNEKYKSMVDLPIRPLDEAVQKIYLATYSYRLYMQGVIRYEENLIKKVQQNRLKRRNTSA
jgi:hypothetical protein